MATEFTELEVFAADHRVWTEDEYLALGADQLAEFDNGRVEFLPMPDELHQWISRFLFLALHHFVEERKLGQTYYSPLPVRLWDVRYREPDIVFLAKGRKRRKRVPIGADLVVEIVNEGKAQRERDFEDKRRDYAAAGIPEYWIVDPESQTVTVLVLDGSEYAEHGSFGRDDVATSRLLSGFSISVDDLFNVPEELEGE
jgi:Uma2 family endonuclease